MGNRLSSHMAGTLLALGGGSAPDTCINQTIVADAVVGSVGNNWATGVQSTIDGESGYITCGDTSFDSVEYSNAASGDYMDLGWVWYSYNGVQQLRDFQGYEVPGTGYKWTQYGPDSTSQSWSHNIQWDSAASCIWSQVYYPLNGTWGWHTMNCLSLSTLNWSTHYADSMSSVGQIHYYTAQLGGTSVTPCRFTSNQYQSVSSGNWTSVGWQGTVVSPSSDSPPYHQTLPNGVGTDLTENYTT